MPYNRNIKKENNLIPLYLYLYGEFIMEITKSRLREIIREEIRALVKDRNPIQEARFKAENGQGVNAKVSKKDGETYVEYFPKDWGTLLTIELLDTMVKKLGEFRLKTSAGLELSKSDVKMIKGTRHGMWKHKGNEVTIEYWASYR